MLGIHDYPLFLGAALLLNVTPGPDTFYILTHSIKGGRKAGIISVLGISSGLLLHTVAVSMGLSAALLTSASLFALIKFIGAFYLVFLGMKALFSTQGSLELGAETPSTASSWRVYRQGLLTNALNPKVALFFLALLPQFVDKASSSPGLALFVLGFSFILTCTCWCVMVAIFASSFRNLLRSKSVIAKTFDKVTGLMFIGLGFKLALSKQPP